MLKRFADAWKPIALIAVFIIAVSFILEFTVQLDEEQRHLLEILDLIAIAVLAIELAVHYRMAKNKKNFLKENRILILSFFPFTQFLRVVRALKVFGRLVAGWASKAFHVVTHLPKIFRAYRASAVGYSKARDNLKKKKKK